MAKSENRESIENQTERFLEMLRRDFVESTIIHLIIIIVCVCSGFAILIFVVISHASLETPVKLAFITGAFAAFSYPIKQRLKEYLTDKRTLKTINSVIIEWRHYRESNTAIENGFLEVLLKNLFENHLR